MRNGCRPESRSATDGERHERTDQTRSTGSSGMSRRSWAAQQKSATRRRAGRLRRIRQTDSIWSSPQLRRPRRVVPTSRVLVLPVPPVLWLGHGRAARHVAASCLEGRALWTLTSSLGDWSTFVGLARGDGSLVVQPTRIEALRFQSVSVRTERCSFTTLAAVPSRTFSALLG